MQIDEAPEIKNLDTKVIKILHAAAKRPFKLIDILGPQTAGRIASHLKVESVEELPQKLFDFLNTEVLAPSEEKEEVARLMAERIIGWAYDCVEASESRKRQIKASKMERKLQNRAQYLPEMTLSREQVLDKSGMTVKERWRGDTDLKCGGLMKLAVEHRFGPQKVPGVFAIQNNLPIEYVEDEDGEVQSQREEIDSTHFHLLHQVAGVAVSGSRLGWVKNHPAWQWLKKCFPKAIDCRAYNHSLNSPVEPGGFFPEIEVKFTKITSVDAEGNIIDAKTDGSGRVHPKHPIFESLARPGGPCVIQIRFINEHGVFAKGILTPDERCVSADGKPEIWMDFEQVKGARKKFAAKQRTAGQDIHTKGYLGVIRCWDRPRTLKWSFEQLQMFHVNPTTTAIVKRWVDQAYKELLGEGIEGLFVQIARGNPQLKLILQLSAIIAQSEPKFSAAQIPAVKKALIERLQKTLYFIAQGAGFKSKQMVVEMDAGIPEGYCVCPGYKPGTEIVVHRFPTLLPQAMVKLKVMQPLPHHLVDGKVVRHCIFMTAEDLVSKMQGDSDGDIVGVTSHPDALELMKHRIGDEKVFMVEPESTKLNLDTDSHQGLTYLMGSPRGNVGEMCLHQAKMFAIQDLNAAIAMAFPYQEAVDLAKKTIEWTDFRKAVDPELWEKHPQTGNWHFYQRIPKAEWNGNDAPEELIRGWIAGRLRDAGISDPKQQNVIAWRRKSKKINPKNWKKTSESGNWNGGNLVHICHDYAFDCWGDYEDAFDLNKQPCDVKWLLSKLLRAQGLEINPTEMSWLEYRNGLRVRSGIKTFGSQMYSIWSQNVNSSERNARIDTAMLTLQNKLTKLTPQEIEVIWRMELTDVWNISDDPKQPVFVTDEPALSEQELKKRKQNNPNYAFWAVSWPGSCIMELLGIEKHSSCQFLAKPGKNRLQNIVNKCMASDNPQAKLVELIFNSTQHAKEIADDNGRPIAGSDCPDCINSLQNALICTLRDQKKTIEHDYIRKICSLTNHR